MKVLIAGAGWLGYPLFLKLTENNSNVFYTERNCKGQEGKCIKIDFNLDKWNLTRDYDVIVCCLPPNKIEDYPSVIRNLTHYCKSSGHFIMSSSTGIYEKSIEIVTEKSALNEDSKLYLAEKELIDNFKNFSILRFGGLIGYDRHPIKYISAKSTFDNAKSPVNLIHQDDCIAIIAEIITNKIYGIYNACSPEHPSKIEYYSKMAEKLNFPFPKVIKEGLQENKEIDSSKLLQDLNYQFKRSIFDCDDYNFS